MFKDIDIEFWYLRGEKQNRASFKESFSNEDFNAVLTKDSSRLKLLIVPHAELMIEKLSISLPYSFGINHKIYVNGYQSWTDSREFFIDEKLKNISILAKPILDKYQLHKYGDYTFKKYSGRKGEFHGYTYTYMREGEKLDLIGSLSERAGFTIIEQYVKDNKIVIEKDCKGLSISKEYTPFDLYYASGSEKEVFDGYFEAMCISKPRVKPSAGWTSWYNYYQNINQDIILDNLQSFQKLYKDIDIFQIDDGYQTAVGDWLSVDAGKFPNGMKYVCDKIRSSGYKAGLWLAPFACETNSMIFREKKHWLLRDHNGEPILAGSNWSRFYALDIYNPEVRAYLKNVFTVVLNDWGYDMVKLDFLYAACLVSRKDKTRGQIMTEAMEFLRECIGDKIILGCGVPLGPAFGLVDYCRIGCDVGLDWNDKFYMRLLHRERVSTYNAIGNTIGRYHLNGRAFLNDPDVFLLREDNILLTELQKGTLTLVNSLFGSLLFTSDNLKKYNAGQFLTLKGAMESKNKAIEKVERYRDNLVEVIYTEEGNRRLALINLSGREVKYLTSLVKHEVELMPYASAVLTL